MRPEQLQPDTLGSDNSNSHVAPVPCQNRRTSVCVCGGHALVTRTMSVIRSPGAIIDPHLLSRVRQLLHVGVPAG